MATAPTAVLPFTTPVQQANDLSDAIASTNSLLDIDRDLDLMLDTMQDELEEHGQISAESRDRFQQVCEAFGQKVDRIGRFIRVMESREAYCKAEAARLFARAKIAENKIAQTKSLVLYFLESRNLTKMEGPLFTLRRQKNSVDSVKIQNPQSVPIRLRRVEARFDGELWETLLAVLPEALKRRVEASLRESEPDNEAIRQEIAAGCELEGVSVGRGHHIRVV